MQTPGQLQLRTRNRESQQNLDRTHFDRRPGIHSTGLNLKHSSTDFELDDNYADDDVNFDESSSKISAKESLEKRRLIDDLLAQRRLERELKDFDYDIDDDDDFDDEED